MHWQKGSGFSSGHGKLDGLLTTGACSVVTKMSYGTTFLKLLTGGRLYLLEAARCNIKAVRCAKGVVTAGVQDTR